MDERGLQHQLWASAPSHLMEWGVVAPEETHNTMTFSPQQRTLAIIRTTLRRLYPITFPLWMQEQLDECEQRRRGPLLAAIAAIEAVVTTSPPVGISKLQMFLAKNHSRVADKTLERNYNRARASYEEVANGAWLAGEMSMSGMGLAGPEYLYQKLFGRSIPMAEIAAARKLSPSSTISIWGPVRTNPQVVRFGSRAAGRYRLGSAIADVVIGKTNPKPVEGVIPLSQFAPRVVVVPRKEWPDVAVCSKGRDVPLPSQVFTTQTAVYADSVAKKLQDQQETPDAVSLVRSGGRMWVFDGHHILVAYLLRGEEPPCFVYSPGADRVRAPRLYTRTKLGGI